MRAIKTFRVASVLVSCVVVCTLLLLSSLPLVRDRLRAQYHLENPSYYESLPADTEANRLRVIALIAENDKLRAAQEMPAVPSPEVKHGRTGPTNFFAQIPGRPIERPYRLSDGSQFWRDTCHWKWGLGDGWLDFCRDVDRSVDAATHYEDDVELYWTTRVRPDRNLLIGR